MDFNMKKHKIVNSWHKKGVQMQTYLRIVCEE